MLGWLFNSSAKKEIENVKEEIKNSFFGVKEDMEKMGQWVTHLNNEGVVHKNDVSKVKEDLSSLKNEISELKEIISLFSVDVNKQLFKTATGVQRKQTVVEGVQTPVQTPVQTGNFYGISNLSVTERAIVWLLANNDMKLSYDDLAAMLGKTRSTIRGQINSIKQKSDGLILEYVEKNGKKRVYMPENMKANVLKKSKVRVKNSRKR
jgi:DNA-binding CsgD family transcriptional regulator